MVRGLSIFQAWFEGFEREYTLIGGTAAKISMDEEGLPFRGTKDLDIVLHVEVLTAAFGQQFWKFLQAGGYEKNEVSASKPCLYRFQKPRGEDFPHTLELFSRVPDGVDFTPPGHLTPIPIDEQVSSLSAILLDDDYYQYVLQGRRFKHGMPSWVGEDRLIPLKALAWMELSGRLAGGEIIDSRKINKHLSDVIALTALLKNGELVQAPAKVKADLQRFVRMLSNHPQAGRALAMQRIVAAYGIEP